MNELPPVGTVDAGNLRNFGAAVAKLSQATRSAKPGLFFLYPKKAEFELAQQGREWLPERAELERIAKANGLVIVDITKQPSWNGTLYREDGVHPTVQGNAVLAAILSGAIQDGARR
jgi:lysophospholipase L1-like esterase